MCAQSTPSNCFVIRIQLNGELIDGPQAITLRNSSTESKLSLENGCFHLPQSLLAEKTLDIYFTVPKNKVYLQRIAAGFFAGTWDIELEDKKFPKDVSYPKHARVKGLCAAIFHKGDEPEREISQTSCRTPMP